MVEILVVLILLCCFFFLGFAIGTKYTITTYEPIIEALRRDAKAYFEMYVELKRKQSGAA